MQPLLLVVPLPFHLLDGVGLMSVRDLCHKINRWKMTDPCPFPAENQTFTGETILLLKIYNIYELFDRRQEFMLK